MERIILAVAVVGVILVAILSGCSGVFQFAAEKKEIILDEDFEGTPDGQLPSGFQELYNGRWYGVVSGEVPAASGEKVLKVWGQPGWCCNLVYYFDVFKYDELELSYKVYVYTDKRINTWVNFVNPNVSWGWGFGGLNVNDNGTVWFWVPDSQTGKYTIKKVKVYKLNQWNQVRIIFYPKKRYIKNYVNDYLVYEAWVRDDGYSVRVKVYPPNEEPFEYISIPGEAYRDPHAYSGLKGILVGDCASEGDDLPGYYDVFLLVGYK